MEKYELPLGVFYGIKPDVCRDGFGTDMAYAAW
ncbi:Uncharacterised protein [Salmonella enterica subsp. enterica]|uniref:Uncharacterized protein n=1 Tax=Salmonella enterica I TaxID=59201 RepID=A0A379WYF0_SALET|nr:Uncharacterised protein [Salmonella enterica subsp. enterica]